MGLRIFLHSIGLVFHQLKNALRISGVLYLVTFALGMLSLLLFTQELNSGGKPVLSWQLALITLAAGVIFLWIAVGWHRFILIDEVPDRAVPDLRGDRMLAYLGRILQTSVLAGLVGGVFMLITFGVTVVTKSSSPALMLLPLAMICVLFLLFYRLAPMLPGAAIGQPIGVRAAWEATRGATGTLILLAIISGLFMVVTDLPLELFKRIPGGIPLGFIWAAVAGWIKLMVGISILTTLYGVYVEKRPLT